MECPLCFEKYTDANQAKGPGGACTHSACDNCWKEIGRATRPPFRCAECRRDLTGWFVAEFGWLDPLVSQNAIEQIAEIRRQADERSRAYERDAVRSAELYRQADEASRAHLERLIAEGRARYDRVIEESRRSHAEILARFNAVADAALARIDARVASLMANIAPAEPQHDDDMM